MKCLVSCVIQAEPEAQYCDKTQFVLDKVTISALQFPLCLLDV